MSYKLRVLSLGAGVQSTSLYLMAEEGLIEPFDLAIFADTGWEREATYKVIEDLKAKYKTPIITVKEGDGVKDNELNAIDGKTSKAYSFLPLHCITGSQKGMLQRKCTNNYKIKPIDKELRKLLGLNPRQRYTGEAIELCLGISIDEAIRMNTYNGASKTLRTNSYPLVDLKLSRTDCEEYLKQHGLDIQKSSCIGCPYHCNQEWRLLNESEFKDACDFDDKIRNGFARTWIKSQELYIHNSLKPLSEVDLRTPEEKGQLRLFDYDKIKVFSNLTLSV
jgi:3'-phosphoadenosine 5'-phosphosulfate sulfotransferase (PAPS reductase)/FAD synthetase